MPKKKGLKKSSAKEADLRSFLLVPICEERSGGELCQCRPLLWYQGARFLPILLAASSGPKTNMGESTFSSQKRCLKMIF